MKSKKLLSILIGALPILLVFYIFILPLCRPGLIVGGDWTFPNTNKQLRVFAESSLSIWSNREIPTGTQVSHQNTYPVNLLAFIWSNIGLDGVSFQKTTLFLTIFGIYWFSYLLFLRFTKNKAASIIGALSYLCSPLVFNYLNMGWNYVLLFLALAPLFTLYAIDYIKFGGLRRIITLGFICAIGFLQSQSIVWFPIIYFLIFINKIKNNHIQEQTSRLIWGFFIMAATVLIINAPWIITSLFYMDKSFSTTSNIDLNRFSVVFSLINSIRNWGSLFNLQFEIAQPPIVAIFSFFPILFIIFSATINQYPKIQKLFYFAISLVLIAPIIYIFRAEIARVPFSSVIRDSSRFLVLTTFGISTGISISLSLIKNKALFVIAITCLVLSVFPFFSGKLYSLENGYYGQNFHLRMQNIPMESYDNNLTKFSNQTNIFFPAGGTVKTKTDPQFSSDFWAISDIQAAFSPYSTGMYVSDKSNPLVINFSKILLNPDIDYLQIKQLLGLYGINNIFNRNKLESLINISSDQITSQSPCWMTDIPDTDWSVTEVCPINDTYPTVYSSVSPIYSSELLLDEINKQKNFKTNKVIVGCPEGIEISDNGCGPKKPYTLSQKEPKISVIEQSPTKYKVTASDVTGDYIIVLNKTFHKGWNIEDIDEKKLNYDHILVNQLVNGWVITSTESENSAEFIIKFYPQEIYARLFPISAGIFILLSLYLGLGLILKDED